MNKCVKTRELFSNIPEYIAPLLEGCEYPWQALPKIKEYVWELTREGLEGFTEYTEGVLIGKGVKIYPNTTIEPPAIIGTGTEVRPGAFIRGAVITGSGCVIGNSSELKNCILLDKVQIPHYNYIGDSVLGERAHTGAGTIFSNLKSDGKNVVVHGECDYETGLRKLGGVLADGADVGCGSVINPGTVIGKNTSVYPLTSLRGVYPADCIVKGTERVVIREKEAPKK